MFFEWFLTHLKQFLPHVDNSLPGAPAIIWPTPPLPPTTGEPPTVDNELPQPIARPDNALPTPPPVSGAPYVNGMKDLVAGGFVTLEEAEKVRAQALASGNDALRTWARTVLPYKYAIRDAATTPELGMTPEDSFSSQCNQSFAHMFFVFLDPSGQAARSCWCPQAFVAGYPRPGRNELYAQGPTLVGYGSFAATVGVGDTARIFADALAQAGG